MSTSRIRTALLVVAVLLIALNLRGRDDAEMKKSLGVGRWIGNEDLQTSYERFLGQPTVGDKNHPYHGTP